MVEGDLPEVQSRPVFPSQLRKNDIRFKNQHYFFSASESFTKKSGQRFGDRYNRANTCFLTDSSSTLLHAFTGGSMLMQSCVFDAHEKSIWAAGADGFVHVRIYFNLTARLSDIVTSARRAKSWRSGIILILILMFIRRYGTFQNQIPHNK